MTYFKSTKLDVSSAGSQYQSQNTHVTETVLFLFQTNASFQMFTSLLFMTSLHAVTCEPYFHFHFLPIISVLL
jgi:hypothetical protein